MNYPFHVNDDQPNFYDNPDYNIPDESSLEKEGHNNGRQSINHDKLLLKDAPAHDKQA